MIEVKIIEDENGMDCCSIDVEWIHGDENVEEQLLAQLAGIVMSVIRCMIEQCGLDKRKILSMVGSILLRCITKLRSEYKVDAYGNDID